MLQSHDRLSMIKNGWLNLQCVQGMNISRYHEIFDLANWTPQFSCIQEQLVEDMLPKPGMDHVHLHHPSSIPTQLAASEESGCCWLCLQRWTWSGAPYDWVMDGMQEAVREKATTNEDTWHDLPNNSHIWRLNCKHQSLAPWPSWWWKTKTHDVSRSKQCPWFGGGWGVFHLKMFQSARGFAEVLNALFFL